MATIHTFTGNEVIATEVPKYLNDNFSALNTETANLSKSVVKTINSKSPVNGNINITGFDSYWEANEQISVGDIRIPKGRENSGYIFECTKAGTTGSTQPEFLNEDGTIEIANFADLGKIGQVRVIFNMAEKEVDEVLALGVVYSRSTYPELFEWAGKRTGLIISEAEWQQKYTASNGKFVPYYSLGDGSTTFRTPLLCAYLKGAESSADVGKYVEEGLPNIEGKFGRISAFRGEDFYDGSAFYKDSSFNSSGWTAGGGEDFNIIGFDASRSNPIYGNSDTVTPETMTGIWVIKAVGVVVDSGNTDITQVLQGVEEVQSGLSDLQANVQNMITNIKFTPNYAGAIKSVGNDYTAPSNGIYWWSINNGTLSNGMAYIFVNNVELGYYNAYGTTGGQQVVLSKGDKIKIANSSGTVYTLHASVFVPMKGV